MNKKDALIAAMGRYYSHRLNADKIVDDRGITAVLKLRKPLWDKDADLKAIERVAFRAGAIRFEACAGTFFFTWKNPVRITKHTDSCIDGVVTEVGPLQELFGQGTEHKNKGKEKP